MRIDPTTEFRRLYALQGDLASWRLQDGGPWRLTRLIDLGTDNIVVTDGRTVYPWGPGLRLEV